MRVRRGAAPILGPILGIGLVVGILGGCAQPAPTVHTPLSTHPSQQPQPQPAAALPPRPLPRYQSAPQLVAAVTARLRTDQTASFTDDSTVDARPAIQLSGEGTLRTDGAQLWVQTHQLYSTPGASGSDLWLVLVPGAGYFRAPPEVTRLPAGKSWIEVDPGDTEDTGKLFGPLLDTVRRSIDPTQPLAPYGDALTLTQADPDQLAGGPTMRYLLQLDVARAWAATSEQALKDVLATALSAGMSTLRMQLWLDAQDRLVQLVSTAPVPSAHTTVSTRVRYSHWGEPVEISPPPADQLAGR